MIDSVRNTVLSVINKGNFGYITPDDFNLYAKQAQIDIFEDYFYQYNTWILKQNNRQSGSGYADMAAIAEEVIDIFSKTLPLTSIYPYNIFELPDDYYHISKIIYGGSKQVDRISQDKILNVLSSNLTAPSTIYPVYSQEGNIITVYPSTIQTGISVQYTRIPKDPKWTYMDIGYGEPLFDSSNSDYQDFELPSTDEPLIVSKILQFAGISIRESDVYTFASQEENKNQQVQG